MKNQCLVEKLLNDLVGQKVKAFGIGSHNVWGRSDTIKTYTITKVICPNLDEEEVDEVYLDVYLKGYDAEQHGLIHTDSNFLKSIKKILADKGYKSEYLDYAGQIMQGENFVGMRLKKEFLD
jgi:hypothetical protein